MKDIELMIADYIGDDYKGLITPELVIAIIKVESGFDASVVRYEPDYRYIYKPFEVKPHDCSYTTEITLQKMSWGLMQIMGAVAREYGFRGWLTRLLSPHENLKYGIMHLKKLEERGKRHEKQLRRKYGLNDLISDYNDGNWRSYSNTIYVAKVRQEMENGGKLQ